LLNRKHRGDHDIVNEIFFATIAPSVVEPVVFDGRIAI